MLALLLLPFPMTAWVSIVLWIALLWFTPAFGGDVIYFKDGMRTLCHGKAWEEKDEVHCEYGGGLLVYPKKDVSRIEKGSTPANGVESNNSQDPGPAPPQPAAVSSSPPLTAMGPSPKPAAGILFYDPRRAKKYWSSATTHHDSYLEALSALAAEFNRPTSWIEGNMGESNDLWEIRGNLTTRSGTSAPTPLDTREQPSSAGGIEFYNPRRPKKFWTSSEAQHDRLDQAIEALAAEFGKPAAWIELHMGEVNDVGVIRRSLKEAQAVDSAKQ